MEIYIFFFFWSGNRDQIACSLLGGFSKPRTAATQSLDSVPLLVSVLRFPVHWWFWYPPLSPLLESTRAPCLQPIYPHVYLSLLLFPPLCPFVIMSSSPQEFRLSPAIRLYDWLVAGASPSIPMFDGLPPRPVRRGGKRRSERYTRGKIGCRKGALGESRRGREGGTTTISE